VAAGFNVNGVDRKFGTPLHAAIESGNRNSIQNVLNLESIIVDTPGGPYYSSLQAAAHKNDDVTVTQLLVLDADVNLEGGKYGNAFEAAFVKCNEKIIAALLPRVANVNMPCKIHGSLLQGAACSGMKAIVKELLDRNANTAFNGGIYGTALQAATKGNNMGHEGPKHEHDGPRPTIEHYQEIAQVLLSKDPTVIMLEGGQLGSALNGAIFSRSDAMVNLVLEYAHRGTFTEDQIDAMYGKALIFAISESKDPAHFLKLLIDREHGANVDCKSVGHPFHHPLDAASWWKKKSAVEYLLAAHASIDSTGGRYGNALRAAVAAGSQDVAILLIEKGADWKSLDREYGNLLQIAAFQGLEAVVAKLLEVGADPAVKDLMKRTTLHVAAFRGTPAIVSMILRKYGHPDLRNVIVGLLEAKDVWGRTPLQEAIQAARESEFRTAPESLKENTRWNPDEVVDLLRKASEMETPDEKDPQELADFIIGPAIDSGSQDDLARPVFSAPFMNPGLGFEAAIVDFFVRESEVHRVRKPDIDKLLYDEKLLGSTFNKAETKPSSDDGGPPGPGSSQPEKNAKPTFRWFHLPANNVSLNPGSTYHS
jgi:ankyrin repeat protein